MIMHARFVLTNSKICGIIITKTEQKFDKLDIADGDVVFKKR